MRLSTHWNLNTMDRPNTSKKYSLHQLSIAGAITYTIVVSILGLLYRPQFGTVLIAIVGGWGAWIICYRYFSKADIYYAGAGLKDREAPFSRLALLILALAWIFLYPWSLVS